jgi:hypothetical protein
MSKINPSYFYTSLNNCLCSTLSSRIFTCTLQLRCLCVIPLCDTQVKYKEKEESDFNVTFSSVLLYMSITLRYVSVFTRRYHQHILNKCLPAIKHFFPK